MVNYVIISGPGSIVPTERNSTKITQYEFRNRFTIEEKVAIEEAAVLNPIVRAVVKDFDSAVYIDLAQPSVKDGVGVFVHQSLITELRAEEILTTSYQE